MRGSPASPPSGPLGGPGCPRSGSAARALTLSQSPPLPPDSIPFLSAPSPSRPRSVRTHEVGAALGSGAAPSRHRSVASADARPRPTRVHASLAPLTSSSGTLPAALSLNPPVWSRFLLYLRLPVSDGYFLDFSYMHIWGAFTPPLLEKWQQQNGGPGSEGASEDFWRRNLWRESAPKPPYCLSKGNKMHPRADFLSPEGLLWR